MSDLDCGACDCDCSGFDCDCMCGDCDCDCDCNCLDNCCSGGTNVILCCFPSNNTSRAHDRSSTPTDCSSCCFCCDRNERSHKSSAKTSKNTKRKGFCSRLKSCFRKSSQSSPTGDEPKKDNVPPKGYQQDGRYPMNGGMDQVPQMGYKQDGRYPINEGRSERPRLDYEEQHKRRAGWEGLDMPPQEHIMKGNWSSHTKHSDRYSGNL